MDTYEEIAWLRCMFCGGQCGPNGKSCLAGPCRAKLHKTPVRVLNGIMTERTLACWAARACSGAALDFYVHEFPK